MKKFSEFLLEGKKKKKTNAEINRAFDKKLGNKPRKAEDVSSETEQKGSDALEEIQKEGRKEKHEKKKAIGKAGVKELKKTQKGNETQKRMEAGAKKEHERKKEIGKAGVRELKKTFSDAKKEAKDKGKPSKVQQQYTTQSMYDAVSRAQKEADKNPLPSSTGATAGSTGDRGKQGKERRKVAIPKPQKTIAKKAVTTPKTQRERDINREGEKVLRQLDKDNNSARYTRSKAAAAKGKEEADAKAKAKGAEEQKKKEDTKTAAERTQETRQRRFDVRQQPTSLDAARRSKTAADIRAARRKSEGKSKEERKKAVFDARVASAKKRVKTIDVVRAKIDREKRKFRQAPLDYTKNVAGKVDKFAKDRATDVAVGAKTIGKPVLKTAKSVATSASKSGTTQARGDSDVSVGKGTKKERG